MLSLRLWKAVLHPTTARSFKSEDFSQARFNTSRACSNKRYKWLDNFQDLMEQKPSGISITEIIIKSYSGFHLASQDTKQAC